MNLNLLQSSYLFCLHVTIDIVSLFSEWISFVANVNNPMFCTLLFQTMQCHTNSWLYCENSYRCVLNVISILFTCNYRYCFSIRRLNLLPSKFVQSTFFAHSCCKQTSALQTYDYIVKTLIDVFWSDLMRSQYVIKLVPTMHLVWLCIHFI